MALHVNRSKEMALPGSVFCHSCAVDKGHATDRQADLSWSDRPYPGGIVNVVVDVL